MMIDTHINQKYKYIFFSFFFFYIECFMRKIIIGQKDETASKNTISVTLNTAQQNHSYLKKKVQLK